MRSRCFPTPLELAQKSKAKTTSSKYPPGVPASVGLCKSTRGVSLESQFHVGSLSVC